MAPDLFPKRQTAALDLCFYVPWDEYNWQAIIQCNPYEHGVKIHWNPAVYCIIAAAHGVTLYTCLELLLKTARTFANWRKLYPWSILLATLGLAGLILTCDLSIFILRPGHKAWSALNITSSLAFLTGWACILYSRLHLVIPPHQRRIRHAILCLIVVDTIAFHVPGLTATIIGTYGSQRVAYEISRRAVWVDVGVAAQDMLLTGVYIWYYVRYVRDTPAYFPVEVKRALRRTLYLIILAFMVVLVNAILSLTLLGLMKLLARYTLLPFTSALSLQIEIFVLNKLVETAAMKREAMQLGNLSVEICEGVQRVDVRDRCDSPGDGASIRKSAVAVDV